MLETLGGCVRWACRESGSRAFEESVVEPRDRQEAHHVRTRVADPRHPLRPEGQHGHPSVHPLQRERERPQALRRRRQQPRVLRPQEDAPLEQERLPQPAAVGGGSGGCDGGGGEGRAESARVRPVKTTVVYAASADGQGPLRKRNRRDCRAHAHEREGVERGEERRQGLLPCKRGTSGGKQRVSAQ